MEATTRPIDPASPKIQIILSPRFLFFPHNIPASAASPDHGRHPDGPRGESSPKRRHSVASAAGVSVQGAPTPQKPSLPSARLINLEFNHLIIQSVIFGLKY